MLPKLPADLNEMSFQEYFFGDGPCPVSHSANDPTNIMSPRSFVQAQPAAHSKERFHWFEDGQVVDLSATQPMIITLDQFEFPSSGVKGVETSSVRCAGSSLWP